MRLVIMGPPGAGKGTQANLIKKQYNLIHISTGEMFREAINKKSVYGNIAKEYIDHGHLVPDDVTIELVKEKIMSLDKKGFLLDGFPRTIAQAEALDRILKEENLHLDKVINIYIDDEKIIKRIAGRRVCSKCRANYHIESIKPKVDGICDICGGELISRADDKEETVIKRLEVYEKETKPLLEYYQKQDIVTNIDGDGDIQSIFEKIKVELGGLK
jgi:adenylate kinase